MAGWVRAKANTHSTTRDRREHSWLRKRRPNSRQALGSVCVIRRTAFPLTAPHTITNIRSGTSRPKLYAHDERLCTSLVDYRGSFNYDDYFDDAKLKKALSGYYACVLS